MSGPKEDTDELVEAVLVELGDVAVVAARSHRNQLGEFAYRPPRIWVTEDDGEATGAGPRTFTSDFKGDRVSRTFYVTQRGVDEARSRTWPPSDDESDAA